MLIIKIFFVIERIAKLLKFFDDGNPIFLEFRGILDNLPFQSLNLYLLVIIKVGALIDLFFLFVELVVEFLLGIQQIEFLLFLIRYLLADILNSLNFLLTLLFLSFLHLLNFLNFTYFLVKALSILFQCIFEHLVLEREGLIFFAYPFVVLVEIYQ